MLISKMTLLISGLQVVVLPSVCSSEVAGAVRVLSDR
jgi:hypothetical protein